MKKKQLVQQAVALKAAAISEASPGGRISGTVVTFGIIQQNWVPTVCCPGAFDGALDWWRTNGFVGLAHDWDEGVAMPVLIEPRDNGLYSEADFHSTDDAQRVRTKCAERLERGLGVGLSVGFFVADGGSTWFNNGRELLGWASGTGYDMSKFDVEAISAHEEEIRAIHKVDRLVEWSVVTIPANSQSWASEVQARGPEAVEDALAVLESARQNLDEVQLRRLGVLVTSGRVEDPARPPTRGLA